MEITPMKNPEDHLTLEEATAMVASARYNRDRLLLLTLLHTGCRISEIVKSNRTGLRVRDIDIPGAVINITDLKKKSRSRIPIPIDAVLSRELQTYLKGIWHEEDFLFDMTRGHAWRIVKETALRAGINKRVHPHTFRHTFAIMASQHVQDVTGLVLLKNMLRHSRIETTLFYLRFGQGQSRELLKKMWSP